MTETMPSSRAYLLGAELRDAREKSGLTLRKLAAQLDVSHSVIVRWERGERVPSTESVAAVCAVLGLTTASREHLMSLARDAALEPARSISVRSGGEADQLAALLEYERDATTITNIAPLVVPGLLQTADYARAIFNSGLTEVEIDKKVMMRLGRRDRITRRRKPISFHAIILEAALHQSIGGSETMCEQLHFLLELGERDNIEIRVIEQSVGWTIAHAGQFLLIEFAKAAPVVHLEHYRASTFLREPEDVQVFATAKKNLEELAMSPEESADLITGIVRHKEKST